MHPYQLQRVILVRLEFKGLPAEIVIVFYLVLHNHILFWDLILGVKTLVV